MRYWPNETIYLNVLKVVHLPELKRRQRDAQAEAVKNYSEDGEGRTQGRSSGQGNRKWNIVVHVHHKHKMPE